MGPCVARKRRAGELDSHLATGFDLTGLNRYPRSLRCTPLCFHCHPYKRKSRRRWITSKVNKRTSLRFWTAMRHKSVILWIRVPRVQDGVATVDRLRKSEKRRKHRRGLKFFQVESDELRFWTAGTISLCHSAIRSTRPRRP